ncbi:hypothetical protein FRC09_008240 [Ceratobasidium sp. 395]|nr:hypothetical protein FRC09_008240 [Ceratobasidium sp. 395]
MATASSSTTHTSPGAGSSKPRPPPIPIPAPQHYLAPTSRVRIRTPTRAATCDQEVELGVYLSKGKGKEPKTPASILASASPSKTGFSFHKSPPASAILESEKAKSFFLANSEWRTDIVTFCSHARLDSVLGRARITHVQARKSRRPPFLHEYLLVFFTAANNQRFVMRLDRLGKIGWSGPGLLGWCAGRHGQASNTAIQQVGVYHIQDSQMGIDSPDGPWFAYDGRWGSEPIATMVGWPNVKETAEQVSHHTKTATGHGGPIPRLGDVSRLLEAILLEMPTYHLVTTNCYFMTRSSLLLLQRCFPNSFACFIGATSGELVASSDLAEPIWAGLLRWYLPFVITVLLVYFPLLVLAHYVFGNLLGCQKVWVCPISEGPGVDGTMEPIFIWTLSNVSQGLRLGVHGILDVPLPIGLLHAWMTALEIRMNNLVTRLSSEYHKLEHGMSGSTLLADPKPFGVAFQKAWLTLAAWCGIGLVLAILVVGSPLVIFSLFMLSLVAGVVFNFKYASSDLATNPEDIFGVYAPEIIVCEPESQPESEPVPSTPQAGPSK